MVATSFKLYRTIHKLPFSVFEDVMCDGEINELIIEGEPSEDQLLEAWDKILTEYSESVGSQEQKVYLSVYKEVSTLQVTVNTVHYIVGVLRKYYAKPIADKLNEALRTSFDFDPETIGTEKYNALLDSCMVRIKGKEMQLKARQEQLESMKGPMEKGEKPTREYFTKVFISLSDHAGYKLSKNEVTVSEYCERLTRFNKHIDSKRK